MRPGLCRRELHVSLIAVLLLSGCSSTGPMPKTGDISFRVTWSGESDVDIYVVSPLGEPVNYAMPHCASGGELDVDCNFRGGRMCEKPMENVYWPPGGAPPGTYRVWILLPDPHDLEADDSYRLEVRLGEEVIWAENGLVSDLQSEIPVMEVSYPSGAVVAVPRE